MCMRMPPPVAPNHVHAALKVFEETLDRVFVPRDSVLAARMFASATETASMLNGYKAYDADVIRDALFPLTLRAPTPKIRKPVERAILNVGKFMPMSATTTTDGDDYDPAKTAREASKNFSAAYEAVKDGLRRAADKLRSNKFTKPAARLLANFMHPGPTDFVPTHGAALHLRTFIGGLLSEARTNHNDVYEYLGMLSGKAVIGAIPDDEPKFVGNGEKVCMRIKVLLVSFARTIRAELEVEDNKYDNIAWDDLTCTLANMVYTLYSTKLNSLKEMLASDDLQAFASALMADTLGKEKLPSVAEVHYLVRMMKIPAGERKHYEKFLLAGLQLAPTAATATSRTERVVDIHSGDDDHGSAGRARTRGGRGIRGGGGRAQAVTPPPAAAARRREREADVVIVAGPSPPSPATASGGKTGMWCDFCAMSSNPFRVKRANTHDRAHCGKHAEDLRHQHAAAQPRGRTATPFRR